MRLDPAPTRRESRPARRAGAALRNPCLLETLRKFAVALNVGADPLVFAADERHPEQNLALHFEAVSQLAPDEQQVILEVIDGLLLKHQAKRWGTQRRLGLDEPKAERASAGR